MEANRCRICGKPIRKGLFCFDCVRKHQQRRQQRQFFGKPAEHPQGMSGEVGITMATIHEFEENLPHEVAELICLNCHQRWIGVYPQQTLLKDIECKCGVVGLVIKTGQTLESEDNEK